MTCAVGRSEPTSADKPLFSPAASADPADWLRESLTTFAENVGSIVPARFDAYARIFHPVHVNEEGTYRRTTWAEAAELMGRRFHPEIQLPERWERGSMTIRNEEGGLDDEQVKPLCQVLAGYTNTQEHCLFAVWNGWGDFEELFPNAPRFKIPGREFLLFEGPLLALTRTFDEEMVDNGPQLWWPEDRAWCIASEIDFSWTYVGGTEELIGELLAHPKLETVRAEITHGITYDSDKINGPI